MIRLLLPVGLLAVLLLPAPAEPDGDSQRDPKAFFEKRVQPLLEKRCYECHSHAQKMKGGLALDSRSGWEQGGDNGPALVPGNPNGSLVMKAVRYSDPDFAMPPKARLPAEEVAILEQWIRSGAHDPRVFQAASDKKTVDLEAGRKFWAFQPVRNQPLPEVGDKGWPLDPIDYFIRALQEAKNVRPAPDASRPAWLRRVSLDLTGLPPTEQDVRDFESDMSPRAFEKVVDRLLQSRGYGERWARHWMDLTGYADMMGTSNSVFAEHAWRYRDYLIDAFNADKPFDAFVREQIAGDLLPANSVADHAEKIVATGFLMVGDIEIVNPDKAKMEADHIDTQMIKIGQTFLGMTLGCARCHDHKFDPIGLEDYYGIAGALQSSPSSHKWPDMGVWSTLNSTVLPETPEQRRERLLLEADIAQEIACRTAEQQLLTEEKADLSKQLSALGQTADARPPHVASEHAQRDVAAPPAGSPAPITSRDALAKRRDDVEALLKKVASEIHHAEFFKDRTPRAFAMRDGPAPADMPIYIRGNPHAPSSIVPRGVLRVASWDKFPGVPAGQSGRLQLAHWLADARNPLTARVRVNRIWQKLFGTGIVPGVDYFGARGDVPTHPELLDHLAARFTDMGWSQKRLIRDLVLSRTYRLTSANEDGAMRVDPENKLYWRMNRQRIDAEALRDSLLAVSGELRPSRGGPGLVLENPENCSALALKGVNPPAYRHAKPRPNQDFERTIYLPVFRNSFTNSDRLRGIFDFIDPAGTAGQRNQTVVPTQALFLLNNDLVRRRAQVLAERLLASGGEDGTRLEALWLRVFNRPITPAERQEAAAFIHQLTQLGNPAKSAAAHWTELCHSLLSSNEFVFRL